MLIAGKYRLEKPLAEGGQGSVYLARHTELDLDPLRVIKIVKSDLFEKIPNLAERFRREVQVTSALSQRCQHIVRIYDDFGEIPSLGRFYVMEHLEGRSLSDVIQDPMGLPNLKVCLHIFHQLCDAMRFAHREDIIHRDLKPDNLMLIPFEDEPLYLKVLDFGIARPTGEQASDAPKLTQGVVGTPEYMAPEQLTGQPIDARADLYAMGVILYEMLTGQTPHQAKGGGQDAFFELVMTRLQEDPLPPSAVRPDLGIHAAMDNVVMTLLKRTPAERYPRVEVLKAALRDAAREIRRSAKTVVQDTAIEFGDDLSELGDAALHFELSGVAESSTKRATIGYDGSVDEDDTPHEAPPEEFMASARATAPIEPMPSEMPAKPGYGIKHQPTSSLVSLSDSFEEEAATSVSEAPALPSYAELMQKKRIVHIEDNVAELPILSEDDFDDETAISQAPDSQDWLEQSIQTMPQQDIGPTKESPSFRLTPELDDTSPKQSKGPSFWIAIAVLLLAIVGLGWWWSQNGQSATGNTTQTHKLPTKTVAPTPQRRSVTPAPIRPLPIRPLPIRPLPRRRIRRTPKRRYRRTAPRRRYRLRRRKPLPKKKECPVDTPGVHWLHVKLLPRYARFSYELGGTQMYPSPGRGQQCMGVRNKAKLRITAKGYRTCIVTLARNTPRRTLFLLERTKLDGIILSHDAYCIKRW